MQIHVNAANVVKPVKPLRQMRFSLGPMPEAAGQ